MITCQRKVRLKLSVACKFIFWICRSSSIMVIFFTIFTRVMPILDHQNCLIFGFQMITSEWKVTLKQGVIFKFILCLSRSSVIMMILLLTTVMPLFILKKYWILFFWVIPSEWQIRLMLGLVSKVILWIFRSYWRLQ